MEFRHFKSRQAAGMTNAPQSFTRHLNKQHPYWRSQINETFLISAIQECLTAEKGLLYYRTFNISGSRICRGSLTKVSTSFFFKTRSTSFFFKFEAPIKR